MDFYSSSVQGTALEPYTTAYCFIWEKERIVILMKAPISTHAFLAYLNDIAMHVCNGAKFGKPVMAANGRV